MAKILQFPGPKPTPDEEDFDRVSSFLVSKGKKVCPDCLGPKETPYYVHVTLGVREWEEVCTNDFHDEFAGGPQVA